MSGQNNPFLFKSFPNDLSNDQKPLFLVMKDNKDLNINSKKFQNSINIENFRKTNFFDPSKSNLDDINLDDLGLGDLDDDLSDFDISAFADENTPGLSDDGFGDFGGTDGLGDLGNTDNLGDADNLDLGDLNLDDLNAESNVDNSADADNLDLGNLNLDDLNAESGTENSTDTSDLDLAGLDGLGALDAGFGNLENLDNVSSIDIDSVDELSDDDKDSLDTSGFDSENNSESLDNLDDFSISGFTDNTDFAYEDLQTSKGEQKLDSIEDVDEKTSISDEVYEKFKKNIAKYPLNLRVELEKVIIDDTYKDDIIFDLIEKIAKGSTARQVASYLQKYLDVEVSVPRDFEKRTAEQYAAYKKSFEYQLKNRILPIAAVAIVFGFICWGLFVFTNRFIYKPSMAEKNYKEGYALLQENMFPQSEIKFNEAVSFKPKKKWYLAYARGYREKKQFDRARAMYERTTKVFDHDKTAGIEWVQMELNDLYNYAGADELVKREILDNHVNDPDGMLLLGDIYLKWATEKDPSKFEQAFIYYNDVNKMYGPNVEYEKRYMRYYIRTDKLKEVLAYKNYFYPNDKKEAKKNKKKKKVLESSDLIELSEFLFDKLYGYLPPSEEYLRTHIENVRQLLDMAVESDRTVPEAYYNLARYFVKTDNAMNAEVLLKTAEQLFDSAQERTPKRLQKNIDNYRLLGEIYTQQQQFLLAEETYGKGISLFETEQERSFLKPTENVGHLYSDVGDLDYFISGNTDLALAYYKKAVENGYEIPSVNYKIGYIEYANKNYSEALTSFLKVDKERYNDRNVMFAMGNILSLRHDDYSSRGYYERLMTSLNEAATRVLLPQVQESDAEIVDMYMKASNNLGVVLHRLANRTGDSQLNAQSMVMFSESMRAWDSLTRNQQTMVRLDGSNLASQNMKYVSHPYSNFSPEIYIEIPRTLYGEKSLEQTFVK